MTVKDMITSLKKYPPDAEFCLGIDEEGNTFSFVIVTEAASK